MHPTPLLPERRATYVGQAIAMVVAETLDQAKDAAELLAIDYDPLPAVVDPVAALAEGALLVEPEFGSNLVLSVGTTNGDPAAAFAKAPVVVEEEFVSHRYVAAPLETRGVQAHVDPATGALTEESELCRRIDAMTRIVREIINDRQNGRQERTDAKNPRLAGKN